MGSPTQAINSAAGSVRSAGSAAAILLAMSHSATAQATPRGDDALDEYASDMTTIGYMPFGPPPAVRRDDPELCFSACQTALRAPSYADVAPNAGFLYKDCHSRLMQTSIFLCVRSNCADYDSRALAGLQRLNETCTAYMDAPLPALDGVLRAYTDAVVAGLRRLQRHEADPATRLSEPVVATAQLYENAYDTLSSWDYVHAHHAGYSYLIFAFWCVVICYGMCSRLASAVSQRFRRTRLAKGYEPLLEPADADGESESAGDRPHWLAQRPRVWLQRHVALPATFGYRCAQDFGWYTVPPRAQTLALAAFAALNVYACCTGYRVFSGNMWWPAVARQYCRYVSDRTGILSFVNFPLIWLFGMRNNVLLWLTGWDFGAFNNFHRWVARIATAQAVVHSVGYTVLVCQDGGWRDFVVWWRLFWWWTGGVATVLMSLLLGLSLFWVRRRAYELFLVVHIVFSAGILLGMVGHVSIFKGRYDVFWLSAAAIWVLDRVLRAARVLAFNPLFWRTRARVTYDPRANIVRVAVPYASSVYRPQPGTYYYLHVLSDSRFWESHPFTVASVGSPSTSRAVAGASRTASPTHATLQVDSDANREAGEPQGSESTGLLHATTYGSGQAYKEDGDQQPSTAGAAPALAFLTFLIRPYDSFTGRLRDRAAGVATSTPASVRVLVDGPYGHAHRFDDGRYASVLFVVGGSGIVVPMSHLTGIAHDRLSFRSSGSGSGPRRLRSVHIVWAVREAAFAAGVLREDLQAVFGAEDSTGVRVSLDIHVTRGDASGDSTTADVLGVAGLPPRVRVLDSRPDVRGEIECAARRDTARGRLGVVACGPGRMADEARRAVVDIVGRRGVARDVEYLEESFQW